MTRSSDPLDSSKVDPSIHTAAPAGVSGPITPPESNLLVHEPEQLGTSAKLSGGKPYRKYLGLYALGSVGIAAIWGAMASIVLPNHVQIIEFASHFTGADAGVNLTELQNLRIAVTSGAVDPTADQERLLGILGRFDAARAQSLASVTAVGVFLAMFIQPIVGVLSDRTRTPWGRRAPWILGGTVLGALLLIALRYSSTILMMAVMWALAQLVINGAQGPLAATVADRVAPGKIGSASAVSGLGAMGGGTLGAVLAGIAFGALGLDTYYPYAIALAVFGVLFVLFARDRSSKDLQVEPLHLGRFFASFLIPLRDADYRWVWIAKIVMMFGYTISSTFGFFMLQSYIRPALSPAEATALAPLMSLAGFPFMLISMVVAGRWSDRIAKRKPFVFWASVIMAASFVVPVVCPALPALFIQAVIGSTAMGAYMVVDQVLFIDVIQDKRTAAATSAWGPWAATSVRQSARSSPAGSSG